MAVSSGNPKAGWRLSVNVGDLIRHKVTGRISIVTWTGRFGAHFKVAGFPINQVFNSEAWECISDSR